MSTWSEKEMDKLRENIVSGLKAGNNVVQIQECLAVPDQMFYDALVQLVENEEIDVLVT